MAKVTKNVRFPFDFYKSVILNSNFSNLKLKIIEK